MRRGGRTGRVGSEGREGREDERKRKGGKIPCSGFEIRLFRVNIYTSISYLKNVTRTRLNVN